MDLEIIGLVFGLSCLIGLYIGISIGNQISKAIKKIFTKEPDVAYIYRNIDAMVLVRLTKLENILTMRGRNRTLTDAEATEISKQFSLEIFNNLSENMKSYILFSVSEDEVLEYITNMVTSNVIKIMDKRLPNSFSSLQKNK